ncbi:DUF308 domain-containing protein [Patescibacteria group bacterium]|nr:DUF308 domain-containing protein [Patescibacteria group bacterium]
MTQHRKLFMIFRAILAIVFAIIIIAWPGKTLATIIALFAIFAIMDGLGAILYGIFDRRQKTKIMQVLHLSNGQVITIGVVEIVVALLLIFWPDATLYTAIYLIAALLLVSGISQFALAVSAKGVGRAAVILGSIVLVAFGLFMFFYPIGTIVVFFWVLGIFLLVHGVATLFGGFGSKATPESTVDA